MKRSQIVFLFIVIFLLLALFVFRLLPLARHPEAGQSTISTTTTVATTTVATTTATTTTVATLTVQTPVANSLVKSPLEISGQAPGNWFFEAVFPIELQDASGKVLVRSQAHAQTDWMTDEMVSFSAKLEFKAWSAISGKLILHNDNPSGLPEKAKSVVVPVRFK